MKNRDMLLARAALVSILLLESEEHTSELQSRLHLVCRLLLEKKKKIIDSRFPSHAVLVTQAAILPLVPNIVCETRSSCPGPSNYECQNCHRFTASIAATINR